MDVTELGISSDSNDLHSQKAWPEMVVRFSGKVSSFNDEQLIKQPEGSSTKSSGNVTEWRFSQP